MRDDEPILDNDWGCFSCFWGWSELRGFGLLCSGGGCEGFDFLDAYSELYDFPEKV